MRLIIDADSLVYAAASVAESNFYCVALPDGSARQNLSYKDAKALVAEHGGEIYKRTVVGPVENALQVLKGMLRTTQKEVSARYGSLPDVQILLTGSSNFRDRLASLARYKFNRVETKKPTHYGACRKYLVDVLGAHIVHWFEADDEAAIALSEDPKGTLVSSIDKDLLQVPGMHHLSGKGFIDISERSGLLRFYVQALAGDGTDGIPGCYRKGVDGAKKQVLTAAADVKSYSELEAKLWRLTLEEYEKSLAKYGADKCGYSDPLQAAIETARLVYLLRERPSNPAAIELWQPPR